MIKKIFKYSWFMLFLILIMPSVAFGHAEADAAGFISGFTHPLFGLDHLLAMLGVGVVSVRLGDKHVWTIPSVFVIFMVIGGIMGTIGIQFPMVELGIAISVIVIGGAIALVKKQNIVLLSLIMVFVATFGSLHGYAHGVEMPGSVSPVFYSFGFIVCTSLIHILGISIGHYPEKIKPLRKAPSYVGSAIAVAGCYLLYGIITA